MKGLCKCTGFFCCVIFLIRERHQLSEGLIRFHVVAASDSWEDQSVKLKVRDAVLGSIEKDLRTISDVSAAREYLQENIPKIQKIVNQTLQQNGFPEVSAVTLCKETFPIRYYDTFKLPSGVYESLRIVIGEGDGKNWWCVAFPTLCIPATSTEFLDAAVSAGFSEGMSTALVGDNNFTLRFFFLEQLGQLENILFST